MEQISPENHPGNAKIYAAAHADRREKTPLTGKKIFFLGSSITYGACAMGESFAEDLAARDGIIAVKEAVSGTTLTDDAADSYISRMKTMDRSDHPDLFVCQLSTNDAWQEKPLGEMTDASEFFMDQFITGEITGAMEYIIAYARAVWHCPVVFYTNPVYASELYEKMVVRLHELAAKWQIGVISMWDDRAFGAISEEKRRLYMYDEIHPTRAGYLEWWTPYFEEKLIRWFA